MVSENDDSNVMLPSSKQCKKKINVLHNNVFSLTLAALLLIFSTVLVHPIPLAHALDGNLYVSSSQTSEVKRYDADTGAFLDNFVEAGAGGLASPGSLAFGPSGDLFVINYNLISVHEIKRYNGTTGDFIDNFISAGSGGLITPIDIAFGPYGNLYVISHNPVSEVKRYNGTTGAFIDNFVVAGSGGLVIPMDLAFGPDENLYVNDFEKGQINRYNGTTGTFIDDFVPAGSGGLINPKSIAFGPDGNLYVLNASNSEIKRYNGTTGAFINNFVPAGSGGLTFAEHLAFGPDGNLYVSSILRPEGGIDGVKRYNGTTGVFVDDFVTSGSGELRSPAGLVFASPELPPPVSKKQTLTVNSEDLSGNLIQGVWTTIRTTDGAIVDAGYTPFTFTGDSGTKYKVTVANYDGRIFSNWKDDTSNTSNSRIISLASDIELTATFDLGDSLRGFTSITYTGTAEQADLTVNALSLDGSRTLNMWTIIDSQSSDTNGTTYKVYVSNYKDRVFDHWEDGSTDRIRTLTLMEAKTITAYYQTG